MPAFACCAMQSSYALLMLCRKSHEWNRTAAIGTDYHDGLEELYAGLQRVLGALQNYSLAFEGLDGMRGKRSLVMLLTFLFTSTRTLMLTLTLTLTLKLLLPLTLAPLLLITDPQISHPTNNLSQVKYKRLSMEQCNLTSVPHSPSISLCGCDGGRRRYKIRTRVEGWIPNRNALVSLCL